MSGIPEKYEIRIEELKSNFDMAFGPAVAKQEKTLEAFSCDPNNVEDMEVMKIFLEQLNLKGFNAKIVSEQKSSGGKIFTEKTLIADLSFNY